jgi:hypothetical protein
MNDVDEIDQCAINALDDLDDDQFRNAVSWHLDPKPAVNKRVWRMLCHPTLVDRTLGCLEEMADELGEEVRRKGFPSTHAKVKRFNLVKARLKSAQARIERIALGPDGQPAGTAPFDGS